MTGPEHYRRAENLAAEAIELATEGDEGPPTPGEQATAATWAALAQVHATLALAAATALGSRHADKWINVAG